MADTNRPIDAPLPPIDTSSSSKFKFIYGAVVCVAALGVLAYHNVDFVERHAPAVNAMLHGGEITDDQDGKYRAGKWSDDLQAILAGTKSKDWAGFRSEILSRERFYADLAEQNGRMQQTFARERYGNLGAADVCERLALDELGPAMDDLSRVESEELTLIRRTTTMSDETRSSLEPLDNRENDALKRLKAYNTDRGSKGCN